MIHRHPEEGGRLAAPLRAWMGEWADTIEQHHERWDGLGYPHQLGGEQICRGARIVAVADAFEVMTAARSYKRPMDVKAARAQLTDGAGSQFDPAMVRAFLMIGIGRMRLVAGPLSWLAQVPFLQGVPGSVAGQAAGLAARVIAGAGLFAGVAGPALAASGAASGPPNPTSTTVPVASGLPPGLARAAGSGHTSAPGSAPAPTPAPSQVSTPAPSTRPPAAVQVPPPTVAPTTTLPPNVPPIARDDTATTTQHKPVTIAVLANDNDPDPDGLAPPVTIVSAPAHGNANPQSSGSVLYVPNDQYLGPDSFVYRVCDTRGGCATATVSVTVVGAQAATTTTTAASGG